MIRNQLVAPFEPYAKFHKGEEEESSLQMNLLVVRSNDDKVQMEEEAISLADVIL